MIMSVEWMFENIIENDVSIYHLRILTLRKYASNYSHESEIK